MVAIGIIVGAMGGFFYWKFIGCASGACPITSNKYVSTIYGAVMGGLLLSSFNFPFQGNQNQQNKALSFQNIDASTFSKKMKEPNTVVIDVRTPAEVQSGYIKGTDVFADIYDAKFQQKINSLDKNKTYLMYCRSGNRSANASKIMIQNGFKQVFNLSGGIGSWNGAIEK